MYSVYFGNRFKRTSRGQSGEQRFRTKSSRGESLNCLVEFFFKGERGGKGGGGGVVCKRDTVLELVVVVVSFSIVDAFEIGVGLGLSLYFLGSMGLTGGLGARSQSLNEAPMY